MDELLAASDLAAGEHDPDANYQRLAAEQAALRRLATLVAGGAEPPEVFEAVVQRNAPMLGDGAGRIVALRDERRNHTSRFRFPFPCTAKVACGHSNPGRREHPRSDGATHPRACADGQL